MKKITVAVCNYNGSVFIGEESEDEKDLQNTLMIGTENGQVGGFKLVCISVWGIFANFTNALSFSKIENYKDRSICHQHLEPSDQLVKLYLNTKKDLDEKKKIIQFI